MPVIRNHTIIEESFFQITIFTDNIVVIDIKAFLYRYRLRY